MTTTVPCHIYCLDEPRRPCDLPLDHDGPHVTRNGRGWHDSDDMDGGVAAALIEKEAAVAAQPPSVGLLESALKAALDAERTTIKERDSAIARAEQAEKERDEADRRTKEAEEQRDQWKRHHDRVDGQWAKAEREVTQLRRAAESRPLMPEVTGEMIERAQKRAEEFYSTESASRSALFSILTAALTEPPARPEGLTRLIDTIREATYDPEPVATGEALYNAGVRVVGEERS